MVEGNHKIVEAVLKVVEAITNIAESVSKMVESDSNSMYGFDYVALMNNYCKGLYEEEDYFWVVEGLVEEEIQHWIGITSLEGD
jgi:hypothetical protein